MATYDEMGITPLSFSASGDMNTYQYRFVQQGGASGYVALGTGASNPMPFGVLQNDPLDGEPAAVRVLGGTQLWFSGSVDLDYADFIVCGSAGGAEKAALSAVQGIALQAISAGSGYIQALLMPFFSVLADNTP